MAEGSFEAIHIPLMDLPGKLLERYCVCYLKLCVADIKNVAGYFCGIKVIKGGKEFFHFEAEDGHDFFVPVDNIAYFQILSEEALKKLEERNKEEVEKLQQTEETNIKDKIQLRMDKVQEQLKNAGEPKSSGNPETEEDGDSEFVFEV